MGQATTNSLGQFTETVYVCSARCPASGGSTVASFVVLAVGAVRAQAPKTFTASQSLKVIPTETTPFRAIVRLAVLNRIPLGIVLAKAPSTFCDTEKQQDNSSIVAAQLLDRLLAGTGYSWLVQNGVLLIEPKSMSESSRHLLNLKFPSFGGIRTSLNGLGVILSGYIFSALSPGQGYAGDILSNPDADVDAFTLTDVTVEQIANYIVSLKGKGAWILQPVPDNPQQAAKEEDLFEILGYSDNYQSVLTLTCTTFRNQLAK